MAARKSHEKAALAPTRLSESTRELLTGGGILIKNPDGFSRLYVPINAGHAVQQALTKDFYPGADSQVDMQQPYLMHPETLDYSQFAVLELTSDQTQIIANAIQAGKEGKAVGIRNMLVREGGETAQDDMNLNAGDMGRLSNREPLIEATSHAAAASANKRGGWGKGA